MGYLARIPSYDTWVSFEEASDIRLMESLALLSAKEYSGSIYLMGYVAEMLLKCAVLWAVGCPPHHRLHKRNTLGGRQIVLCHDLMYYVNLLESARVATNPMPRWQRKKLRKVVLEIEDYWNETIRYKSIPASRSECVNVLHNIEWLIDQYSILRGR